MFCKTMILTWLISFSFVALPGHAQTSNKVDKETAVESITKETKSRRKKVEMCLECGKPEPECECEGHGDEEGEKKGDTE